MGWILTLIVAFIAVVLSGSAVRSRKSDYPGRKMLNQAISVHPDVGPFIGGFRQTVIKKGILMALFMIVTPRKRKKRALPSPEEPCLIAPDELAEMVREVTDDKANPLHWPLVYARAYRHAEHTPEQVWDTFLQGTFIYTRRHNPAQALMPLQKAVEAGFLPAYGILGDLYAEFGDTCRAIETIIPASDAGYAPAIHQHACYFYQESLGKMFQHKRLAAYRRLFSQSAKMGYPPSQLILDANNWA